MCQCCAYKIPVTEVQEISRIWEGRLNGYCIDCAWSRCDALPGDAHE